MPRRLTRPVDEPTFVTVFGPGHHGVSSGSFHKYEAHSTSECAEGCRYSAGALTPVNIKWLPASAELISVYIADIITTATITIIGDIITITAIGETYRVVAVSKLALRRARAAAHAAAFSLFGPMLDSRHEPRGHICRAATAAWYQ